MALKTGSSGHRLSLVLAVSLCVLCIPPSHGCRSARCQSARNHFCSQDWNEWKSWSSWSDCQVGEQKQSCKEGEDVYGQKIRTSDHAEISSVCQQRRETRNCLVICKACTPENLTVTLHLTPSVPTSQHQSSVQWPVARLHIITADEDKILFMSGRQTDSETGQHNYLPSDIIWSYTPSTSSWAKTITTGSNPPQLKAACAVKLEDRIFLQGGVGPEDFNDDLFIYEMKENKWRKEEGGGKGRWGSVCFSNKETNEVHMFGGGRDGGFSNELRTYKDGKWQNEIEKSGPTERAPMGATTVGDAAFLHGGTGGSDNSLFDDLWRFNLTDKKWEEIQTEKGAAKPEKRSYHSITAISDDVLLLVGGEDDYGDFLKDVWTYKILTNEWKKREDLPTELFQGNGIGLAYHRATPLVDKEGSRSVYVTGGFVGESPWQPNDMLEFNLVC